MKIDERIEENFSCFSEREARYAKVFKVSAGFRGGLVLSVRRNGIFLGFDCCRHTIFTKGDGAELHHPKYGRLLSADEFSIQKYMANPKTARRNVREYIRKNMLKIIEALVAAKAMYREPDCE